MIARDDSRLKSRYEDIGRLGAVLNVVDEHLHTLTPTRCISSPTPSTDELQCRTPSHVNLENRYLLYSYFAAPRVVEVEVDAYPSDSCELKLRSQQQ